MFVIIKQIWEMLTNLIRVPTIVTSTTTANWNSGVATSGQPGADLFTLGTPGEWFKLSEIYLGLYAFNAAATVTVRVYEEILGAERLVMDEDYIVAAEPDIVFIFWFWEIELYGQIRIEVFSDQGADDGLAAPYEYRYKEI